MVVMLAIIGFVQSNPGDQLSPLVVYEDHDEEKQFWQRWNEAGMVAKKWPSSNIFLHEKESRFPPYYIWSVPLLEGEDLVPLVRHKQSLEEMNISFPIPIPISIPISTPFLCLVTLHSHGLTGSKFITTIPDTLDIAIFLMFEGMPETLQPLQ